MSDQEHTLDPQRDRWLEEHRPGGERIVPAAVIAGWLLEAAPPGTTLHGIRWLRPLRVPNTGTTVRVEGVSRRPDLELSMFAPRHRPDGTRFGHRRIASALAVKTGEMPAAVLPRALGEGAIRIDAPPAPFHGPLFDGLRGPAVVSSTGLDARVEIVSRAPDGLPRLVGRVDARHLDVLFQAAGRLHGGPVVPYRVRALHLAGGSGDPATIRVRRSGGTYNLWIGDRPGHALVQVEGYEVRAAAFLERTRRQR